MSTTWIDKKYINLVSFKLQQFKQKSSNVFNFRCPYCGDSQKNKLKARGYIYTRLNKYYYRCHNCAYSITFNTFLKNIDPNLFRQYLLEKFEAREKREERAPTVSANPTAFERLIHNPLNQVSIPRLDIPSINELPEDHPARVYIQSRQIPEEAWEEIYYTDNYKQFIDRFHPEHGKDDLPDDARIVLLFTNLLGEITGFSGRSLEPKAKIRYASVKLNEEKKLFGTHKIDLKRTIYVTEGQFDSLFVDNCVASGDSSLEKVLLEFPNKEVVLIYDCQPRNKDIVRQIETAIKAGCTVCLLPESESGKDINEMVLGGATDIMDVIRENTFSGLELQLKFSKWKKV